MSDFWKKHDHSYRLFSQFCSTDDWYKITSAIAGAIVKYASSKSCQTSILDIGCGTGTSTETICEQIFTKTRCFPSLTIVEPSQTARERVKAHILPRSKLGPLYNSFSNIKEIPEDYVTDAILFLHSTYYIDNFEESLKDLINFHLRPGGAVFALVLPEQSPFFLDLPPLPNCANKVESLFRLFNLDESSFTLRSRFQFPDGDGFSKAELESLRRFWRPTIPTTEAFGNRLVKYADATLEIDFQDHLIIGKKLE